MSNQYGLPEGYQENPGEFFDDTPLRDQWQKEVYEEAAKLARDWSLTVVLDVGCGSGFKLLANFPEPVFDTTGMDLEPTVRWLLKTYPNRKWRTANIGVAIPADLVICADVLEHIPEPGPTLDFIWRCRPCKVVFSTPDRDLVYSGPHLGPPRNKAHIREWSFAEFPGYLEKNRFVVERHFISNRGQATQCAVCRPAY